MAARTGSALSPSSQAADLAGLGGKYAVNHLVKSEAARNLRASIICPSISLRASLAPPRPPPPGKPEAGPKAGPHLINSVPTRPLETVESSAPKPC